jgi:cytochrome P450
MRPHPLPVTPLSAVTHPDPYPYYAALVQQRPFYRDGALGMWVASSARAVQAVLTSPALRVRPVEEPVPMALSTSAAGLLFGRLVRMTDGALHAPLKRAVTEALGSLAAAELEAVSRTCALALGRAQLAEVTPEGVQAFTFGLSVHVTAALLGLPAGVLQLTTAAVDNYVRGLAPGADAAARARAAEGAALLQGLVETQLASPTPGGLLARFSESAARAGCVTREVLAANAAGFLTQAYEATAGLIGNTLLALGTRPELAAAVRRDSGLLDAALAEVVRYDAPVQNTRRYVGCDAVVGGQSLVAGESILVLLAAAGRDPQANPEPERFDLFRGQRHTFTFGGGPHLCPGQALSWAVARAGVAQLLGSVRDVTHFPQAVDYQPSHNVRIPRFVPGERR